VELRSPSSARTGFRAGLRVPTASWAAGFAQANLIVLPQDVAGDFGRFARRNPGPCPLLEITQPGSPVTRLAPGADLPARRLCTPVIQPPWASPTCRGRISAIR
jgi:uncharacterized protein YcsI (UPF0317 family)